MSFVQRFVKTASSVGSGLGAKNMRSWFHSMHKNMNGRKSTPAYSRKGVSAMLKRRGVSGAN